MNKRDDYGGGVMEVGGGVERQETRRSTDHSSVVFQFSVAAEGSGPLDESVPLTVL